MKTRAEDASDLPIDDTDVWIGSGDCCEAVANLEIVAADALDWVGRSVAVGTDVANVALALFDVVVEISETLALAINADIVSFNSPTNRCSIIESSPIELMYQSRLKRSGIERGIHPWEIKVGKTRTKPFTDRSVLSCSRTINPGDLGPLRYPCNSTSRPWSVMGPYVQVDYSEDYQIRLNKIDELKTYPSTFCKAPIVGILWLKLNQWGTWLSN